jgi:hypothetical protein
LLKNCFAHILESLISPGRLFDGGAKDNPEEKKGERYEKKIK